MSVMPVRFAAERHLMIAGPFRAGIETPNDQLCGGATPGARSLAIHPEEVMRRPATRCLRITMFPRGETPGYLRISLREKHHCNSPHSSGVLIASCTTN
ncbi:MAG: hypothetical protein NT138_05385 [Planctomycetales bacterium]|nr:hypothetical protein [Planctomycetales bacterium]